MKRYKGVKQGQWSSKSHETYHIPLEMTTTWMASNHLYKLLFILLSEAWFAYDEADGKVRMPQHQPQAYTMCLAQG